MSVPTPGSKHLLCAALFFYPFFAVVPQNCFAQLSSGSDPNCGVKGDPKDSCSALSPQVRGEYTVQCKHQQYGYLDETWRADERAYWSCRLRIPQEDLAEALEPAEIANEIERLTPFKIGKVRFLMIDESGGTAECRSFSIVAQLPEGWAKVWELPEQPNHYHCGYERSPQILFDGQGFTLRLSESYVRERVPPKAPPETWAYRWTGKSFELLQAPRVHNLQSGHKRP